MKHSGFRSITLTVSLIIIAGFVISGISTYFSFQALFKKDVESVSELTSENIYVNISNLMDRPINVSTVMAHDTFLRDFMNAEQAGGLLTDELVMMQQYLQSYQEKYEFDSVFFVSAKTNNYYHYKNGLDRTLTPGDPEDTWYYDFLQSPSECSLNVDNDQAREDLITIFVNCKLLDEDGNILGVVGVGMVTPYIQDFLLENEQEYGVQAYLIDSGGSIQVSSTLTEFEDINLFEDPSFQDMADAIDTNTTHANQRWYHSSEKDGYVITRYIPNMNWFLVVEKSTQEFKGKMLSQLLLSFVFMLCVVLTIIAFTIKVIKNYDFRLKNLAEHDQLTGIGNRTSYEWEVLRCGQELGKHKDFAIGVWDLNNLKAINDVYGHQAGDECLKVFASKLRETFTGSPVFRIGGDEFVIIFQDVPEQSILEPWARLSTELRRRCEHDGGIPIRAAFGYSFWSAENLDKIDKIFKDADDKMYLNKKSLKSAIPE